MPAHCCRAAARHKFSLAFSAVMLCSRADGLTPHAANRPSVQMPTRATLLDHITTAQVALFSYAALPLFAGFIAEKKLTFAYASIDEVGWPTYLAHTVLYFACVDFCIYWIHRELHDVKFLYNNVHLMHHKYNKPEEVGGDVSVLRSQSLTSLARVVRCRRPERSRSFIHRRMCCMVCYRG